MTTNGPELFDAWINMPSASGLAPDPSVQKLFKNQSAYIQGTSVEQLVADMDAQGVAGGILTKVDRKVTGPFMPALELDDESVAKGCSKIVETMEKYPGRFLGSIVLDPRMGYAAARHVRIAVKDFGMSAIRIMPVLSLLSPDDKLCYPLYTAACDLGVPVTVNVGMPGPQKPARLQDPMALDEVSLAFPDLNIVMTHIGDPWIEEVVALLSRRPNLYLMTSGWIPKYIPEAITRFMSSRGPTKVMWASDYPILPIDRTAAEGRSLNVKPEVLEGYLGKNARAVFGSPKSA
jgi:uncharacterized protein